MAVYTHNEVAVPGSPPLDWFTSLIFLTAVVPNSTPAATEISFTSSDGTVTHVFGSFTFIIDPPAASGTITSMTRTDGSGMITYETITGLNVPLSGSPEMWDTLFFGGDDTFNGWSGPDLLFGWLGNDILNGAGGNDTMIGHDGNDTYFVDSTGDTVIEIDLPGAGIDTILTSVTLSALPEGVEKLTLLGGALNGTGNALANTIVGNAAANILNGLAGVDTLNGGGGNDTYFINSLGEVLIDSGGIDTVKSLVTKTLGLGFENLTLLGLGNVNGTGNAAANIINGNAGKNTLSGLGSSDVVNGGGGNDVLIGGFGRDTMNGGAGLDRFDFNAPIDSPRGIARDVINGFSRLQHDRIDLSTIDADTSANPGNDVFKFIGTQAFHGGGGEVRFAGGIVQADINGDKIADLEIKVSGLGAMLGTDFIL